MKQISCRHVMMPKCPKQQQKRVNIITELVQLREIDNCIFLQKHNVNELGVVI